MAKFKVAYEITRKYEGGYSNHPNDRGGESWKGIARNKWPQWEGWRIIDSYKKQPLFPSNLYTAVGLQAKVEAFFKSLFWDINHLSLINNQDIANEIFDTGVNMGTATAVKMLQEALNILNRGGKDYPDLKVDGVLGNKTIAAVNKHPAPAKLLKTLNGEQYCRYKSIVKSNPSQEVFFNGWLERV